MLDAGPQVLFVFSRVRQRIDGPRRTYLTRIGREGEASPYYHSLGLAGALTFAAKGEARDWLDRQRPEVQTALVAAGFRLVLVETRVVDTDEPARPAVAIFHPDNEARRAQLARLWADADGDDGRVKGTLHPNDRIAMGPGVLISDDAPELPDAEAEHEARQIDYAEAVRNFTLPEPAGEPCYGDDVCDCPTCRAVFAAS